MKTYRLTLKWEINPQKVVVEKPFPNDTQATSWMHLYCENCGRDEYGNKYIFCTLEEVSARLVYAGGN